MLSLLSIGVKIILRFALDVLFGAFGLTVVVCCLLGELFVCTYVRVEHEAVTLSV